MKEYVLYFSFVCLVFVSVFAAELPDIETIESTIQKSFSCRKNNPALSVSIVKDGKIVFANGYGVESLDSKIPVTNTTLFGIASLTKTFTSTLLAKLTAKSRKYSLNSRVAEFYGNSPVFDGYLRSKFASIKDLLSHRMGIPMHNFIRFDKTVTRRNLIRRLKELKPRGRFRDSFYYSNIMYGQAARLAEKIGRLKYEDLIEKELFKPLGMSDSDFFTTANESLIELATGYMDVYGELHPVPFELSKRWSSLCGANCILSSAVDMAKWMIFHLNHGRNQDGKRVMPHDALEDTHRPENVLAKSSLAKYYTKPNVPETFSQTGYGLGWRTGHYRGYNMMTHTGSSWGYKNMITLYPDMKVGVYTAMTGDDDDFVYRYSLHQYLADMYMGLTPWLNSSTICSFPDPWLPVKPKRSKPVISRDLEPNRTLDEYLGVYENPAYGKIEMFILDDENSTNKLIAEYGYVDLILYPKSRPDEFFFETDGIAAKLINFGTIQFKSTRGVIDKLRIPSFEPKDPPVFKKLTKPPKAPLETVIDPKVPAAEKSQPVSTGSKTNAEKPVQTDANLDTPVSKTNEGVKSAAAEPDISNTAGSNTQTNAAGEKSNHAPDTLSEGQGLSNTDVHTSNIEKGSTDSASTNTESAKTEPKSDKGAQTAGKSTTTKTETSNKAPEASSTKENTEPNKGTSTKDQPKQTEAKPAKK